jgi:hypothetical protein
VVLVASLLFLGSLCDFRGHHFYFFGFDDFLWRLEMNDAYRNLLEFIVTVIMLGDKRVHMTSWKILLLSSRVQTQGDYMDMEDAIRVSNTINLN